MSNAREQLTLRNRLQTWLEPHEVRQLQWQPLMNAAADALTRGWTGDELARWCIADIGPNTDNIGGTITTTLRQLGTVDPPRDTTPTPEPCDGTERAQRIANAATPEQRTHWANHIRQTIADTPTRSSEP